MQFGKKLYTVIEKALTEEDQVKEINEPQASTEEAPDKEYTNYTIEVITDLEGNRIPQRYYPVYLEMITDPLDDNKIKYSFTNYPEYGTSSFSKKDCEEQLQKAIEKFPALANGTHIVETPKITQQTAVSTQDDENVIVPDSKTEIEKLALPMSHVIHPKALVDTREIEAFAQNGIHPYLAFARNPKPGWWYTDENGKSHMLYLYGITEPFSDTTGKDVKTYVMVRELEGFDRTGEGEYLTKIESKPFFIPVEQFVEIIHSDRNKDIYDDLMKKVPKDEQNDELAWLDEINTHKQNMLDKFEEWKSKNSKYNLKQYTPNSILNAYYANVSRDMPIEIALKKYGRKIEDIQTDRFMANFDSWYKSNKDNYKLDRFSKDDVFDIYLTTKYTGQSILDALLDKFDFEDTQDADDVVESIMETLTEAFERPTKDDIIIDDPNVMRKILTTLNFPSLYVSNPFIIRYPAAGRNGKLMRLDKVDEQYIIDGLKLKAPSSAQGKIGLDNIAGFYIRPFAKKGARREFISYIDLYKILNTQENRAAEVTPENRYKTWAMQKKPLNKGAKYTYQKLPDEMVEDALGRQKAYPEVDAVELYRKALANKKEDKFVTQILRTVLGDEATIRAIVLHGIFIGYMYARAVETQMPIKKNWQGNKENPYIHLLKF